jgi:UDP-GlcNAc:undecaprenyl-phosphate GlcNAc-1-phosphate transferase
MQNIILSFLTSLLVVIFGIPSIITVAKLKGLYDKPDNRKIHTAKIQAGMGRLQFLQAAIIILFFLGLKDDVIMLSPIKKLMSQLFATAITIVGEDIRITSFYGIFGIYEIPIWASYMLTLFTIVVITNAFNLIDGVDGLAGGLGFIISITFGLWFNFIDQQGWSILAFALSGALLGFLVFNFNPAKIFMGDAGSITTGFLLAVFAVRFIEFNSPSAENSYKLLSAPAIAVAILIIPLFDTLRVFIIRLMKKKSPFSPDQNHLHHSLIRIGLGHKEVSLVMYIVNILFVLIAFMVKDSNTLTILMIIGVLALVLAQIPIYILNHKIADLEADQDIPLSEQIEEQIRSKRINN